MNTDDTNNVVQTGSDKEDTGLLARIQQIDQDLNMFDTSVTYNLNELDAAIDQEIKDSTAMEEDIKNDVDVYMQEMSREDAGLPDVSDY